MPASAEISKGTLIISSKGTHKLDNLKWQKHVDKIFGMLMYEVTPYPLFSFSKGSVRFDSIWLMVMEGGRKGHLIFQLKMGGF